MHPEFVEMEDDLQKQIQNCTDAGAVSSDDEGQKAAQSKADNDDSLAGTLIVGSVVAVAVGALAYGILKFQKNN